MTADVMQFVQTLLAVVMAVAPMAWSLQRRITSLETKMELLQPSDDRINALDRRVLVLETKKAKSCQPQPDA